MISEANQGRSPIIGDIIPHQWRALLEECSKLRKDIDRLKSLCNSLADRIIDLSETVEKMEEKIGPARL